MLCMFEEQDIYKMPGGGQGPGAGGQAGPPPSPPPPGRRLIFCVYLYILYIPVYIWIYSNIFGHFFGTARVLFPLEIYPKASGPINSCMNETSLSRIHSNSLVASLFNANSGPLGHCPLLGKLIRHQTLPRGSFV